MRFLLVSSFIFLSGCTTYQIWETLHISGKTIGKEGALANVDIYIAQTLPAKPRRLIGKSDAEGKFDIEPILKSSSCFLITCMGTRGISGSYVFEKNGYVHTVLPYWFGSQVLSTLPPEVLSKEVLLRLTEQ